MGGGAVAVVGLGGMGSGMAHALLAAGFPLVVFNRTPGKATELAEAGATVAGSAGEAAEKADIVVLSLADETAVEDVLFGTMLSRMRPGSTVVDTSTVSPEFAGRAAARLASAGMRRLEACVIGNPPMARAGQLRVFVAGDERDMARVDDVLGAVAQEVRYLGAPGRASALKLAFNLLLGVQTAGLADAVALAEAAGIDRELVLGAIEGSGWRSPVLSFRAGFMRTRNYRPAGFRTALMHKDLVLAQAEALAHGVDLPVAASAAERFAAALAEGHGDDDAAVVVELKSRTER